MIKKIKYILLLSLIFILVLCAKSYARITTNDPTVNSGESVTITVNSQEAVASGGINISSNGGLTFKSAKSGSNSPVNGTFVSFSYTENQTSGLAVYTFTAPTVTETTTYKVVFSAQDMANAEGATVADSTATATVTVKAKETPKPDSGNNGGNTSGGNTPSTPSNPSTPTVKEPNFTSVSKTVYATSEINLRSSWSTSSSATRVSKGTELRLTGTSTEKINGYVWYRVTYEGKVKYVAKDLITETKEEEKSNNANLKTISIENAEITPSFDANVTEYSAKITDYEETKINITAEAEDEKSEVKIEGNDSIAVGENVITITVTAEDGTTKIYTITLVNEKTTVLGLSNLIIRNAQLKNFSTSIYEYTVEFKDLEKLDIVATANEEGATIEILGNENLAVGENVITIIVTSADGTRTATYQIKATKLATEVQETQKQINGKSILISALIAFVVLVIIIILIIKYVKKDSNSNIDYVYNDNLNKKDKKDDMETAEEITPKEEKIEEDYHYDEEEPRRPRKGKHSK